MPGTIFAPHIQLKSRNYYFLEIYYLNSKNLQAVFEEWYFKKLQDDLKKKQTAEAEEEAKLYAQEMEKLEKKENATIEYEKWLLAKKEQLKKAKRRKLRRDASKEKVFLYQKTLLRQGYVILFSKNSIIVFCIFIFLLAQDSEEKQERIQKAELEWKEKKMKERRLAQKQLQKKAKKEMEEEKKKMEKQMESAKTFQSWQVGKYFEVT